MGRIVGIDLGTTNSEVAVIQAGKPFVIPDEEGRLILPSFVGMSPAGELLVGQPAKHQYIAEPENTVRSIKRKMGTDTRITLGGQVYTPPEISAFILRKLKEIAEEYLGEQVDQAVITVPAYFSDAQRQATRDAGEIAGLKVARIINEPTAAALAYGMDLVEDQFIAVYDLGGGTFDVSIIEINSGVVEVRANHGNTQLGGDDFDERIVDYVAEWFTSTHGIDLREDGKALARITRAAEVAKIELSNQPYANITEEFIATRNNTPLNLEFELSRTDFENLIEDVVDSTLDSIEQALEDAELEADDIDKVLMVGGSTRIPLVWEIVCDRLGIEPKSEIDPDLCVAMGAGVQAGIIAGEDIDAYLVDVTSHSLGIAVAEIRFGTLMPDRYSVLVRRNAVIPTSKSEVYSTIRPNQEAVEIKVYQGENPIASENTLLGEFLLEDIPPAPAGAPQIIVTFDYDVDGIVHVSAKDKETGNEKKISLQATPERLTEEQKATAKEKTEALFGAEAIPEKYQDTLVLAQKAKRIAQSTEGEEAEKLLHLAEKLEVVVRQTDEEAIEELEDELLDVMYDFDFELEE